eukprot:Gregarina_sp_Pseudo_9__5231@NODE_587_length_2544_cov_13_417565_g554_i0_p1_GENE_NODE_587_length_2544_cov_13_417565_g554_i0NODE_587_length_2544_cov_13_417565_g554_i0_p1_ORF_typecomplete_len549_score85_70Pterin_bind/PF00809_22/1_9e57HPPK/PF01288_20/7_2e31_NODE_587_length_2544_cov_13_417565_g554_i08852531
MPAPVNFIAPCPPPLEAGDASTLKWKVYLGLGSNIGNRVSYIETALMLLQTVHLTRDDLRFKITNTSSLYETTAAYVNSGPKYLNCVVKCDVTRRGPPTGSNPTKCSAASLLRCCKDIEAKLGRNFSDPRNSPRVIDIDVLVILDAAGKSVRVALEDWVCELCGLCQPTELIVPHPRLLERLFVLEPLCDIDGALVMDDGVSASEWLLRQSQVCLPTGCADKPLRRLVVGNCTLWPLSGTRADCKLVGIVNCTPDSFSDGGNLWEKRLDGAEESESAELERESAGHKQVAHARHLIAAGCHALDIGAESTRPGAAAVSPTTQITRLAHLINALASTSPHAPCFVDTRHTEVYNWCAIRHPAIGLNDVSGLTFDPDMLEAAVQTRRTCVVMHSRGLPETMTNLTDYGDRVVETVAKELSQKLEECLAAGVYRWRLLADPGIGFAKTAEQNLELIKSLNYLQTLLPRGIYFMLGLSRKRFLRQIDPGKDYELDKDSVLEGCTAEVWETLDSRSVALMTKHDIFKSSCCLRIHDPRLYSSISGSNENVEKN